MTPPPVDRSSDAPDDVLVDAARQRPLPSADFKSPFDPQPVSQPLGPEPLLPDLIDLVPVAQPKGIHIKIRETGGRGLEMHRGEIQRALDELSDEFRLPVVLRDLADLDYAEIAEVLGLPAGTVRSRIARGRAKLAALLDHLDDDPGNQRDDTDVRAPDTT